jgi:hypothetical protein
LSAILDSKFCPLPEEAILAVPPRVKKKIKLSNLPRENTTREIYILALLTTYIHGHHTNNTYSPRRVLGKEKRNVEIQEERWSQASSSWGSPAKEQKENEHLL